MRANLAGATSRFYCPLPAILLMVVAVSSCSLLKKKGDTGPDAQASAVPVASIAPIVVPSVASVVTATSVATTPHVHAVAPTHTHTSTSTGTTTAAAPPASGAPIPPPIPEPSAAVNTAPATSTAPGIINPQCLQACQKGYQDCMAQSAGTLTAMDLIKKCRLALTPCQQACR